MLYRARIKWVYTSYLEKFKAKVQTIVELLVCFTAEFEVTVGSHYQQIPIPPNINSSALAISLYCLVNCAPKFAKTVGRLVLESFFSNFFSFVGNSSAPPPSLFFRTIPHSRKPNSDWESCFFISIWTGIVFLADRNYSIYSNRPPDRNWQVWIPDSEIQPDPLKVNGSDFRFTKVQIFGWGSLIPESDLKGENAHHLLQVILVTVDGTISLLVDLYQSLSLY